MPQFTDYPVHPLHQRGAYRSRPQVPYRFDEGERLSRAPMSIGLPHLSINRYFFCYINNVNGFMRRLNQPGRVNSGAICPCPRQTNLGAWAWRLETKRFITTTATFPVLEYEIKYRPSFSILEVRLGAGDQITAEAGAMVYMSDGVLVKTRTRSGGLFQKVKVSMLGGESFFVNDFFADRPSRIGLAAPPLGDVERLEVRPGLGFIVQSSGYIASTSDVVLDTEWQGFGKGIFGASLFARKRNGAGG